MTTGRVRRLSPAEVQDDRDALIGLQTLADYAPRNALYSVESLTALERTVEEARQAEIRAQKTLAAARDTTMDAEFALHQGILGAKTEVIAQYGVNAQAVQVIGLKRKSERRRPSRRMSSQFQE